ncbi:MAG: nicotinate phosphoribosyltransferase [Candidatus Melainabacteria bacterium]|nr:nicotinate phosphoribosyltransferase [Candidatus Melainabacteria bacterium]
MVLPPNSQNRQAPVLLTDLYQLTMAYAYWKSGYAEKEAAFTLSFRRNPFNGGFAVFSGLKQVIDYVQNLKFYEDDLSYLSSLKAHDDSPLFDSAFIDYLAKLDFNVDIQAVADGTVVFAQEPLLRVVGPIIPGQILETALLNLVCFSTLISTKATRIKLAAKGQKVYEFGLRRAQGMDGGITASLAAYLGGCDGTSNVLAGKLFGIPVKGTHAHSWIMAHESERQAFVDYAEAMPNNCVFLVDTFDTLIGVKHAIEIGNKLKANGQKLLGIRLDSGDLAYLSINARKMLDEAGFPDAAIMASNDLDETLITSLKDQGAEIDTWAVGTKLVTGSDQPSLGGVYKLSAVRSPGRKWRHVIKLSEQTIKVSTPGLLQCRRFMSEDRSEHFVADMIFDETIDLGGKFVIIDPLDFTRRKNIPQGTQFIDLLKPIFEAGKLVYEYPGFEATRKFVFEQLAEFHPGIKRLVNPHQFPVGLEAGLHALKTDLVLKARGLIDEERIEMVK